MGNTSRDERRFIMLPSALLYELSNTALRIILYAKRRQGLVDIGRLSKWDLTIVNIHNEFKKFKGYSKNTIRNGIRELKVLNLIIPKFDHYAFNEAEFEKWNYKDSENGVPNSGREGLSIPGRAVVPNSGSQKKSIKNKNNKKAEQPIGAASKGLVQEPEIRKSIADELDELFPELKEPAEKSCEEQFDDIFGAVTSGGQKTQDLSASATFPSENPTQTPKTTDTKEEINDSSACPAVNADNNNHPIPSARPEKRGDLPVATPPRRSVVDELLSLPTTDQVKWLDAVEANESMEVKLKHGADVPMTEAFKDYFANM